LVTTPENQKWENSEIVGSIPTARTFFLQWKRKASPPVALNYFNTMGGYDIHDPSPETEET
jgi:hypothetical protein